VILGSDKAQLTVLSGDKKAWPLYLSIGNIHSRIRNSPSRNAWILIAYIPVVHFDDNRDSHGTCINRLFHQCMGIVLKSLIQPGETGVRMTDAAGDVRKCYPLVAAYLADYPEQVLINAVIGNASPVTLASYDELGDPVPSPPRTRQWVLETIEEVCARVDPADIKNYLDEARDAGLNGVNEPFWKDLPRYQPELAMCPDILHGVLRFWRDHIFLWAQRLVGEAELDRRIKALQPIVGFKRYPKGVAKMTQWTGREDRELQRILIGVIAGAPKVDAKAMRCFRAFHDFAYLVQYRSHSDTTLGYLSDELKTFHENKEVFIEKGVRRGKNGVIDHFCIPKLAALHSYITHIPEMGTSPQYSTEITEACHRPMAKDAYRATNHKDYVEQMCRFLDRNEKIRLQREFIAWAKLEIPRRELQASIATYSPRYQNQSMEILKKMQDAELQEQAGKKRGPKRGLWLTEKPKRVYGDLNVLCDEYLLPDLKGAINSFLGLSSNTVSGCPHRIY
jgi:Plavaka transposase